jgi:curved DNA-binding protein CbpA
MTTSTDYYEVLQVSPNADVEVIEVAYKRLAYKWHPDRNPGDPSASERMKLLNEAYEILVNPQKRQEHDLRKRPSEVTPAAAQETEQRGTEKAKKPKDERVRQGYRRGYEFEWSDLRDWWLAGIVIVWLGLVLLPVTWISGLALFAGLVGIGCRINMIEEAKRRTG